jgi:hypothetical protein
MYPRTFTLFAVLVIGAVGSYSQSGQTLTGTITDSMCGAKHMMANASAAQCTQECVKQGSDYALVSGGKVYTLKGKTKELDKYAGQTVTVIGQLSGSTLTVDSVSARKS